MFQEWPQYNRSTFHFRLVLVWERVFQHREETIISRWLMSLQRNLGLFTVSGPLFSLVTRITHLLSRKLTVAVLSVAVASTYGFGARVWWPRNS
jgi:hypothetical protein